MNKSIVEEHVEAINGFIHIFFLEQDPECMMFTLGLYSFWNTEIFSNHLKNKTRCYYKMKGAEILNLNSFLLFIAYMSLRKIP